MKVFRDPDNAPEEREVLLFCIAGAAQVAVLARRHWWAVDDTTRRQGWQSTWAGAELPKEWRPYAYALIDAPDPAADEGSTV